MQILYKHIYILFFFMYCYSVTGFHKSDLNFDLFNLFQIFHSTEFNHDMCSCY